MARVTIEDCLEKIDNRFKLVLLASKRAEQLIKGASSLVEVDGDKPVVLALREIADGFINERLMETASNGMFADSKEESSFN